MDNAQGLVAFLDGADNDTEGDLVIDPLQGDFLDDQFFVDGIDVLGPADDPQRLDVVRPELVMEDLEDLVDIGLALGQGAFQMGARDRRIRPERDT